MSILVLTSDTLIGTPATGNLEYNGQFFGTDSNASRAQLQRITTGTAVASTSGTSIDFTSIPSWVKRLTVIFNGVGTSGTVGYLIQIGSGSVTSSGYVGGGNRMGSATGVPATSTAGFLINSAASGGAKNGSIAIKLMNTTFGYVADGVMFSSSETNQYLTGGAVTLSGLLDRVRITTTNGTDTFSAGSINIMYEG
jgi:hypothetical protein